MQAPANSGSNFFNYKKSHSIVLMALCNGMYEYTFVDIGNTGRISDGGVLSNSSLNELFLNKTMFPDPSVIVGTDKSFPYVVVGDEAFPLKENLMKPYPSTGLSSEKRIFNYRLSRARRITENTFGITAARFRVLRRPIIGKV